MSNEFLSFIVSRQENPRQTFTSFVIAFIFGAVAVFFMTRDSVYKDKVNSVRLQGNIISSILLVIGIVFGIAGFTSTYDRLPEVGDSFNTDNYTIVSSEEYEIDEQTSNEIMSAIENGTQHELSCNNLLKDGKLEKHTLYVNKNDLKVNNFKPNKIGVKTYKLNNPNGIVNGLKEVEVLDNLQ